MTAGAGILHEEFHSSAYARTGGPFELVQLWVNLPAKDKRAPAGYQAILDGNIPAVPLLDVAGSAADAAAERRRRLARSRRWSARRLAHAC